MRVYPFEEKNRETGAITNMHKVDLVHTTSDLANSEMELITIKLKEQLQADRFQSLLGKKITIPARVWAVGNGSGFWLEKGILPTPEREQAAPAPQATPKAA
jgi:hypothetical protein